MSTNVFVCMLCVPVYVSGLVPFKNSFSNFIYLFLAGLGLHCLKSFFSSCSERASSLVAELGLLMASLLPEPGL